jgi:hypothetical protein
MPDSTDSTTDVTTVRVILNLCLPMQLDATIGIVEETQCCSSSRLPLNTGLFGAFPARLNSFRHRKDLSVPSVLLQVLNLLRGP